MIPSIAFQISIAKLVISWKEIKKARLQGVTVKQDETNSKEKHE